MSTETGKRVIGKKKKKKKASRHVYAGLFTHMRTRAGGVQDEFLIASAFTCRYLSLSPRPGPITGATSDPEGLQQNAIVENTPEKFKHTHTCARGGILTRTLSTPSSLAAVRAHRWDKAAELCRVVSQEPPG